MKSFVTGRYVKLSLSLTCNVWLAWSGVTRFTLSPPGFRLEGTLASTALLTIRVNESDDAVSTGASLWFVHRLVEVLRLPLDTARVDFFLPLFFLDLDDLVLDDFLPFLLLPVLFLADPFFLPFDVVWVVFALLLLEAA